MSSLRTSLAILLIFIVLPFLAACGGDDGEAAAQLPTRYVQPSDTPTDTVTPTVTPTPTATDTPTPLPSFTPTDTPSDTPTPTITPTVTDTPTQTSVPATSTPSMTPTFTLTATPTNTPQPSATPTPSMPEILTFGAPVSTAQGGTQVTLNWQAVGDIARIDQLNTQGQVVQSFSVTPTGQLPVTIPTTGSQVIYRLTVQRGGEVATRSVPIQIQPSCGISWFFGGQPEDGICPISGPTTVNGSLQIFQDGVMINLPLNGQDRVYGFNQRNNRYMVYTNNWDGSTTYTTPCGTAPSGLQDPGNVFNWAYHNTLGTTGLWCDQNNGIGWAIAAPNLNVTFTVQFAQNGQTFYIAIPGYGTLRVSGQPQTGTWARIQ